MRYSLFLVLIVIITACSTEGPKQVPVMTFKEFEPMIQKNNDTVYVINFWATWCKPCIKELPEFEKFNKAYKRKPVKVILVSLDFPDKYESQLLPFIKENQIKSQVIHLTETDANKWIDKVSGLWSGSIPATLIYKRTSREFYEKQLSYDDLVSIVDAKMHH